MLQAGPHLWTAHCLQLRKEGAAEGNFSHRHRCTTSTTRNSNGVLEGMESLLDCACCCHLKMIACMPQCRQNCMILACGKMHGRLSGVSAETSRMSIFWRQSRCRKKDRRENSNGSGKPRRAYQIAGIVDVIAAVVGRANISALPFIAPNISCCRR